MVAVADGVGGWATQGVDPGIYSRKLCSGALDLVKANAEAYLKDPQGLMKESWSLVQELGSSTLVLLTLPQDEPKIHVSMVGDSGYLILRNSSSDTTQPEFNLQFESQPQQKGFNFPYQLGWAENGDSPEDAIQSSHLVKDGDLLILGTDGVFDNLSGDQVNFFNCREIEFFVFR